MSEAKNNSNILSSFLGIFYYALIGLREMLISLLNIIPLAFRGIKFVIIKPFMTLFNIQAKGVDTIYKKVTTNNSESLTSSLPTRYSDTFLGKLKKVLTSDLANKKLSAKEMSKLEEKRRLLQKELADPNIKRSPEAKVYVYQVQDKNGRWIKGKFIGFSKQDVNSFLLSEGYEVYNIENNKWVDFLYGSTGVAATKMRNSDLIFWLTQLSTYVKAGIPLTDSVKIIMNQWSNNKSKQSLMQSVAYQLTMGEPFSSALEKQGDKFPPLLINMIKAAEATGDLQSTLDDMANYYTDIEENRKEVVSAITYPLLVGGFAVAVIIFIFIYVIPQFTKVYASMNMELKGSTLLLLNLSNFFKNYGALAFIGLIGVLLLLIYAYKKVKSFRIGVQLFAMKLPGIGKMIIYKEMMVFAKTFSSLLNNNVDITKSVDILGKITNNEIYKDIMRMTIDNISKGDRISTAFEGNWAIPDVAYYMIVTGESTGELGTMMGKVSDYYKTAYKSAVESAKSLIEPIMIVTLALVVGVIILSVIVPIFSMYESIM